ncbi:MAG: tetratricopeptide repeat protein [Elusimicrobia bacterium]|nr:tetratricopeptide repeat protein [Elusimicrobiota bacterium]MBK7688484.1 tetratricopeptide repeat protein [Elusimicrobiota bacterium]MBL0361054.1 tetratricopeptide repeat protein [Elusimicrobiota bacterium]
MKRFFVLASLFAGAASVRSAPSLADWADPAAALARSTVPLSLAESFLDAQAFLPVAAHREALVAAGKTEGANRLRVLEEIYAGNNVGALQALELVEKKDAWLQTRRALVEGLVERGRAFTEIPDDRFVFRTPEADAFLVSYARPALDGAHGRVEDFFGSTPSAPVIIEILPSVEAYAWASGIPKEKILRTGAVATVRFNRVMALSPSVPALGYRWIDALVHEYAHWHIRRVSGGLCPAWLSEGVARYLEIAWRRPEGFRHTPHAKALLTRAALDDGLIPFSRMEGSFLGLENAERTDLAFAQTSDAVAFLVKEFGVEKVATLLASFRQQPRAEAFSHTLGLGEAELEKAWRDSLADLTEKPTDNARGALGPVWVIGDFDEATLVGSAALEALRAGDRLLKQSGAAAAAQYKKVVEASPDNGVALTRLARAHLRSERPEAAEELLKRAIEKNPDYAEPLVVLGEIYYEDGRYEEGQDVLQQALEIRPFYAAVHGTLGRIALDVGNFAAARSSLRLAVRFDPTNEEWRRALSGMPKNR